MGIWRLKGIQKIQKMSSGYSKYDQWMPSLTQHHGLIVELGYEYVRDRPIVATYNDKTGFSYRCFPDVKDLYTFILGQPPDERHFHEVILAGIPRKPFFDIDIDVRKVAVPPGHTLDTFAAMIQEALLQGIRQVLSELGYVFKVTEDVAIYASHKVGEKFSIHIVLPCHRLVGHLEGAAFYQQVLRVHQDKDARLYEHLKQTVDAGVYKPNSNLRMYGSSKLNEPTRIKTLVKTFLFEGVEYEHQTIRCRPEIDVHAFSYFEMVESLVSFTGFGDRELKISVPVPATPLRFTPVLDGDLAAVMALVYQYTGTTAETYPYRLRNPDELGQRQVLTDRLEPNRQPLECKVCSRTHTSNTPWIRLWSPAGGSGPRLVYYGCFSSWSPVGSKGFCIGTLAGVAEFLMPLFPWPPQTQLVAAAATSTETIDSDEEFELEISPPPSPSPPPAPALMAPILTELGRPDRYADGRVKEWRLASQRALVIYPGRIASEDYLKWFQRTVRKDISVYLTHHGQQTMVLLYQMKGQMDRRSPKFLEYEGMRPEVYVVTVAHMIRVARFMTAMDQSCQYLNEVARRPVFTTSLAEKIVNAQNSYEVAALAGDNPAQMLAAMRIYQMAGSSSDTPPDDREVITPIHPFQMDIECYIKAPEPNGRTCLWITDAGEDWNLPPPFVKHKGGRTGKSMLLERWLKLYGQDIAYGTTSGSQKDLVALIIEKRNAGWNGKVLVIDMGRADRPTKGLFITLECILNGRLDKVKYEPISAQLEPGCKIIIFSNLRLTREIREYLSSDRWISIDLWERYGPGDVVDGVLRAGELVYLDYDLIVRTATEVPIAVQYLRRLDRQTREAIEAAKEGSVIQKVVPWWEHIDDSPPPEAFGRSGW
jgi:hypothetical protein